MVDVQYRVLDNTVKKLKDMGDGTHAERVVAEPPLRFQTDGGGPSARLRVDSGQTGFFAGRMFRMFYEFSIPQAGQRVIRFTSNRNFILWQQSIDVDAGGIKCENITTATPAGSWTGLPKTARNRMTEVPLPIPISGMVIETGGTVTGETVVDVLRVRSAANQGNSRSSTVGDSQSDERGLPAGVYYLRLTPLAGVNETSTGVLHMAWEERP